MISIKSNLQYLLLFTVLALPLLEICWNYLQIVFEGPEGGAGFVPIALNAILLPFTAELCHWVYRRYRSVLYETGDLKEVLFLCWMVAPFISLFAFLAYFGGLFAMGLICFFLWKDWKEWGKTTENSRQAEKSAPALEPSVQLYFLMAVLVLPFPGLWWALEHGGFEFLSLNTGRSLLVLNLYLLPFIAKLFYSYYSGVRKELYRTKNRKNLLIRFGVFAPLRALFAFTAYLGGLLAMGLIGFFLWRDWKEFLHTGSQPAEDPEWAPAVNINLDEPLEVNSRFFILIGAFLFHMPWVIAYAMWMANEFFIGVLSIILLPLFFFPPVGRLCWVAYLQLSERLQREKNFQDILSSYLAALLGFPVVISVTLYLCAAVAGLLVGVGSFFVMLAIGYFLWQDRKEIDAAKTESLNTEG